MKKRFSFESKITGILLVILGLVTITGLFAYRRFTDILADIVQNVKPDTRLITAEALLNSIYDAEISVKSFSLTRDTLYLDQFYRAAEVTDRKLGELHDLSQETGTMIPRMDSLDNLVDDKIAILNELLLMQDKYRVQLALNRVTEEISPDTDKKKDTVAKDLLGRLFRNNEILLGKSDPKMKVSELNREIDQIREREQQIADSLKIREMALIRDDQEVSEKIQRMLDELKMAERIALMQETRSAEIAVRETNSQIAWFCFATGTLLLFMAALIIKYVRNNNRYRIALRNSRREAEGLAESKQRFLTNMSHEIRTPMNAIAGFTEQIAKGPLTPDQREQLAMVHKSSEHLLHLINEVLDFSRLQADKLKLERIGFRPAEVINEVVNFMRTTAEKKNLHIKCRIVDEIPQVLIGDPFRLRQILLNLVNNALKFTEHGSVELRVTVVRQEAGRISLRFDVIDTGIGMDRDQLEKVFKEFEQGDASTSRNFGGSGLGLSIVNMLVTLHHGKILLSSEPGVGTTVSVQLSYQVGSAKDIAQPVNGARKKTDVSVLKKLNVLVVDDEEYNRKLLTTILKNHHATYKEACNGNEALQEVSQHPFDIILMDARMPDLSGIEATQRLRQFPDRKRSTIPVIALTAAVTKEDRENYRKAGMNGFLAKPFKEQELINEIERVMKNDDQLATPAGDETGSDKENQPSKKSETMINLGELQAASNGDVEFYIDMLELFIDGTRKGMDEIQKAFTIGDWERMANYAHKISSPCRHIAARQLYNNLKEIETRTRARKDLEDIGDLLKSTAREASRVLAEVEHELQKEKAR